MAKPSSAPTTRSRKTQPDTELHTGLVIAHYGQVSLVETGSGQLLRCQSRRKLPRTVCGDRVEYETSNPREGIIRRILARSTSLVRPDRQGRIRPLAANIDQVVIVIASKPSFELKMLDPYLVAAELIGARPLVVINKQDLLDADSRARLETRLQSMARLGYPLIFTSTKTTDGLTQLHRQLREHTSVLVGQSGVGKSSLVQALLPDLDIRVGKLSRVTGLGRHTTTTTTLYHLPDSGDLIDSPGVREFTLWPVAADDLARGFIDFHGYAGQCRFHNCRHNSEPGCAITEAVRRGDIDAQRYASYRRLLENQMG